MIRQVISKEYCFTSTQSIILWKKEYSVEVAVINFSRKIEYTS